VEEKNLKSYFNKKLESCEGSISYDTFSDMVFDLGIKFKMPSVEASRVLLEELKRRGLEIKTQEATRGEEWPSQERVVPFSKAPHGWFAEPKSFLTPLTHDELARKSEKTKAFRYKINDYVEVAADTWRSEFKGYIKRVNEDGTVDIKDPKTGWVYEEISKDLINKPKADGRPIAPPGTRRIGDPAGMMDSPSDVGGRDGTREYPGLFHEPAGTPGNTNQKYISNPPSLFYKEASKTDRFYSYLKGEIVSKYGERIAIQVEDYLYGRLLDPSKEVVAVLQEKGVMRLT